MKHWTLPTYLTFARILLAVIVIMLILLHVSIYIVVAVFVIAALTDLFDGILARRYHWVSTLGAHADMVADRVLWCGTTLAVVFVFGRAGRLELIDGLQLIAIMAREIISLPFAVMSFARAHAFPPARYIAKVTTFLQGFALPALLLSFFYPAWRYLSLPLAVMILCTGARSAWYYIQDVRVLRTRGVAKQDTR
jgi:phosphatidylglycerophosphate synthase